MAAACVFCDIIGGRRPAHIVLDDDDCLAFLDVRPVFPGHTLLVPRPHHETLADLPDDLLAPLLGAARLLSRAVERGLGAHGSFVAVNNRVSQSVPHLHVHVVPRRAKDGLRGFFWPRQRYDGDAATAAVATALRVAVAELREA